MDCSSVVLNKLLTTGNLDIWSKLKLVFLDPAFAGVYSVIRKHYDKYGELPNFDTLELEVREGALQTILSTLKLADVPDVPDNVALEALIDQYTQDQTIKHLDGFIDKLPLYDTAEIKENLANIVLQLDEQTLTTEGVYNMADIMLFHDEAELNRDRVHLGLNNSFDAALAGVARQELILVGGKRGAGKSIACSNIMVNQYENGNTCVYFTIEMQARETLERNFSILADVNYQDLKQNKLSSSELLKVIEARAGMFTNANTIVDEFLQHRDKLKFEQTLVREFKLKEDNQMIIIDDRALTITSLDLHLGKIKAKFGDKFKVAVVDYLNQIVIEGGGQFDWQPQIVISKKLKELARKHDIVMFTPYQIDDAGQTRFAKGILDAADIALIMEAHDKEEKALTFSTTKIRGGREMTFTSPINWDSLRISPVSMEAPVKQEKIKNASKKSNKHDDSGADAPW